MAVASLLLALLMGSAFTVLLLAISDLRASGRLLTHSREANASADRLEELVIDLETGVRGFVITRQERFLEPWRNARAKIPGEARTLEGLADQPELKTRAREIAREAAAYITEYSVPLVNAARQNKPAARGIAATAEGKRRVDALRRSFESFRSVERTLLDKRQRRNDTNAGRAVTLATVGLAGSILLIFVFGGYLARAIVRPLRRASLLAGQLAAGDLGTRMPERSVGEIGTLERSFNSMAASLEQDREQLRRLADEQAALRRVATLVARGVPPDQLVSAVTRGGGLDLGCRSRAYGALRGGRYGHGSRRVEQGRRATNRRHPLHPRGSKYCCAGASDARPSSGRQFRRGFGTNRTRVTRVGNPFVRRLSNRRRRATVGRDRGLVEERRALPH
jgi:CHASE3 domain sensor protein